MSLFKLLTSQNLGSDLTGSQQQSCNRPVSIAERIKRYIPIRHAVLKWSDGIFIRSPLYARLCNHTEYCHDSLCIYRFREPILQWMTKCSSLLPGWHKIRVKQPAKASVGEKQP